MSEKKDLRLNRVLGAWYDKNKRKLPWRETRDPYLIWISEVILQQTRVVQGKSYYKRFVEKYPTVSQLAEADEQDIMKLWQGLGYYRRAQNMHTASKTIMKDFDGGFPVGYKDVLKLKGVGEYTAAAIVSFAYNQPYATVDGNVYRVLSRIYAIDEPIDGNGGKKMFATLAQQLLDDHQPGLHNQAMMEFGALQCVPVSPDCSNCPASEMCMAYTHNKVSSYPVKKGKTKTRNRYFNYIDIRCGENMYIHKREKNDIWQNLFELPLIESEKMLTTESLIRSDDFKKMMIHNNIITIKHVNHIKHILSHQVIFASFYQIELSDSLNDNRFLKILAENADEYPVSRLTQSYLEQL